jgi:hypothetical protein
VEIYSDEFKRLSRKERKQKVSRSLYEREELAGTLYFQFWMCHRPWRIHRHRDGSGQHFHGVLDPGRQSQALPVRREALYHEQVDGLPWIRYTIAKDSIEYVMARSRLLS